MPNVEIAGMSGVESAREETRTYMALIALAGFVLVLLVIVIGFLVVPNAKIDDTLKLITTVSSILSGVVGAIVGFYFRSERQ